MTERKLTTWEVLRNRFPANEAVLIEEVSDASGFSRSRSLDYMLVQLWESRGLTISGIERKSNRGDWLKELKNPQKQEKHFKYCDYFFLLTDKEGVAKSDEIPETWGWYHIDDKQRFRTLKPAPRMKPVDVNRSLLCAMLRRAADKAGFVRTESIESRIAEAVERAKLRFNDDNKNKAIRYDEIEKKITEFKEASGIDLLSGWRWENGKDIGEAVRFVMEGGLEGVKDQLLRLKTSAEYISKNIDHDLKQIESCDTSALTTSAGSK